MKVKGAQEGLILAESKLQVLEEVKEENQVAGEIETEHLACLVVQDTFYAGIRKAPDGSVTRP